MRKSLSNSYTSILFLVVLGHFTFQFHSGWNLLERHGFRGEETFGDLSLVLNQIECTEPISIWHTSQMASECGYLYSLPLNLVVRTFNFYPEDVTTIAVGLILSFLVTNAILILRARPELKNRMVVPLLLILCSPPYLLLVERANADLIIFFLIGIAAFMFSKQRRWITILILVVSTGLKPYSGFAAPLLLRFGKRFIAVTFLFLIYTLLIFVQTVQITESIPQGIGGFFGGIVVTNYLREISGISTMTSLNPLFSFLILILVTVPWLVLSRHTNKHCKIQKFQHVSDDKRLEFLFFATIFVGMYTASSNYDYRLVFVLPLILLLVKVISHGPTTEILLWTNALIVWLSFTSQHQYIGEFLVLAFCGFINFIAIKVIREELSVMKLRQSLPKWFVRICR
jgi:hypothetical protein